MEAAEKESHSEVVYHQEVLRKFEDLNPGAEQKIPKPLLRYFWNFVSSSKT